MKKIISNIADSYGLRSIHKEYSKEDQFSFVEDEVYKLNDDYFEFYKNPIKPKIYFKSDNLGEVYEDGMLKFSSQVDNGTSNNEAIFHYSKNLSMENNTNIILVHGWRSKVLNRLENVFLDTFINRNYNIYRYILPYHMERTPNESLYSGEYFVSADVSRTLKSVQQSVSDIRALINHIKAQGNAKIVVIGLSLGGIITNLLSEVEVDIDVLISLFYGNDLSFSIFKTDIGKYIIKDFLRNDFSYSSLNKSWKVINPSLRVPILDLDKILLVSGRYDKYVLKKDTDQLWNKWGRPERYIYYCGHSGIVLNIKRIRKDVLRFIDKRL